MRARLSQFGPGLLYAGAAVGVSHLVQSTRAGAEFGFQLLFVVILVNVIKYPIFEVGPRYAAATGETLLDGYKRMGIWAVWVYVGLSVLTMFIIMAAISLVTAGLFSQLFPIQANAAFLAVALLGLASLILSLGQFKTLDKLMKLIVVLLTVSTAAALGFSFVNAESALRDVGVLFTLDNRTHLMFLVALIGWMPAPVDISIWHSVWSVSKSKASGKPLEMKQSLIDFKVGYWGTMVLAAIFLSLGAITMHGVMGQTPDSAGAFAELFISIYTQSLGEWAFPIIAIAAFTTMFSTLLTCLDAFPRTLRKATKLIFQSAHDPLQHRRIYNYWLIFTAFGSVALLLFFLPDMRAMVDFATTVSFVIAPVLAILSFVAISGKHVPQAGKQPKWLKWFYIFSTALLIVFSVWYIVY